ncbi:hypothetical protein [uncultured Winogradskyella sp.]|uniref:hypothetical protein n=1 Tax=uncultured Winogradskyella sp. TaxID=395353 RepID=UPI003518D5F3
MRKIKNLVACLFFAVVLSGCEKDEAVITNTPSNVDQYSPDSEDVAFMDANFGMEISADFFGRVSDMLGRSIVNAKVEIGGQVVYTDFNGIFSVKSAGVFERHALIKIQKAGYVDSHKVVIPNTDEITYLEVYMLQANLAGTVNSNEMSTVTGPNNSQVEFSGDFIKADGSVYNGPVNVYITYLDVRTLQYAMSRPGNGLGQTLSNEAKSVHDNYGMINVKLQSPSGEDLNIDPDSEAVVIIPKTGYDDDSPSVINFWSFNENLGFWEEQESKGLSHEDTYWSLVNHFSWWTASPPQNYVDLCFSVTVDNDENINAFYVYTLTESQTGEYLDSGGLETGTNVECILVPEGLEFNFELRKTTFACIITSIDELIGPFTSNDSLNFNIDSNSEFTQIMGTVNNCSGAPLDNGYVFVNAYNYGYITDGTFNLNVENCSDVDYITVQIYDFDTGDWFTAEGIPLNSGTFSIDDVSTCDDSGGTFNADIILSTQNDVNEFGALQFNTINGNITIGTNNSNLTDITDLSPLSTINAIDGNLRISNNPNLTSLEGLSSLTSVGVLRLLNNDALVDLNGLQGITEISSILIWNNDNLQSLSVFDNLNSLQTLSLRFNENLSTLFSLEDNGFFRLTLESNPNVSELTVLQNQSHINILEIKNMDGLSSLHDLAELQSVNWFQIIDNDGLVDLNGLQGITEISSIFIGNNDNLATLNGLENLLVADGIHIGVEFVTDYLYDAPNPVLSDFCALQNLFTNGSYDLVVNPEYGYVHGYTVINNAFNPNINMILNGACSQ